MSGRAGVFICPSCQAVVKSETPLEEGVTCGECQHEFGKAPKAAPQKISQVPRGRKEGGSSSVIRNVTAKRTEPVRVVGGFEAQPVAAKSPEQAKAEGQGFNENEMIMPDGSVRVRRRKKRPQKEKNKALILFLLGWFCVIALVFALFKSGKIGKPEKPPVVEQTDDGDGPDVLTATEIEILNQSIGPITEQFNNFLNDPNPASREQFIDRSAELALTFTRHYQMTPFPKPESKLSRVGANIINFSNNAVAVETIWADEAGHKWGAVHVFDNREGWKLDWEAFAPYSTEPWSRFRAGLGSEEGVFRLLVRKRRTSDDQDRVAMSFYRAPRVFETDNEYRNTESPEVEVPVDSALGKEFLGLWTDHLEGNTPYGAVLGKVMDPANYLRITVRLAWEKNERDEKIMVLKEIVGIGWYGKRLQDIHQEALNKATEEAKDKVSGVGDSNQDS